MKWTPTGPTSWPNSLQPRTFTRILCTAFRWSAARVRLRIRSSNTGKWGQRRVRCWWRPRLVNGRSHLTSAVRKPASFMARADNRLSTPNLHKRRRRNTCLLQSRLKTPSQFRLVGKPVRRLDSRPKCDGSIKFGLDLDLPGMKTAVVARPPVFGGRVKTFDDKAARSTEGV